MDNILFFPRFYAAIFLEFGPLIIFIAGLLKSIFYSPTQLWLC